MAGGGADSGPRAVASVCPLDCPDRCTLDVTVEAGRVTSIDGSRLNPVTEGFICGKVRHFDRRLYGPDRLLHPMRRSGPKGTGAFERVTWDEALDEIAKRLSSVRDESGGEAILPFCYGGSNGLLTQDAADAVLFRGLGASRLLRTVCAVPTGMAAKALYGKMPCADLPDVEASRFILIWGANPRDSNIHLVPYLKRAKAAGARIAVIDPRRTPGGALADRHLAVWPGTDGPVALAMIAHLDRIGAVDRQFLAAHATGWERLLDHARTWSLERAAEVARVAASDIAAVAEEYAAADPAMVRCGWGLERNRNGESAVAAVLALPAVAGKFGRPGGGYMMSSSGAYRVDDDALAGVPEPATRAVNMNHLGRVLCGEADPPVRALFVYNANPAVTIPDQNRVLEGLRRDDLFTVVFDQVRTDTALYADVLLPATTFLEHRELSTAYGTYGVLLSEPAIAPVGESRPNGAVFTALADRLGLKGPDAPAGAAAEGDAPLLRALASIGAALEVQPAAERLALLRRAGRLRFGFEGGRPVPFVNVWPATPDRKAHLWPEMLGSEPYGYLPEPGNGRYPLALISPATDRSVSSSMAEYGFTEAALEMHPEDAAARGLADGAVVRVHNERGVVVVRLRLSGDLRRGVAVLPKGIWNRHTRNGSVGNALVPDTVSGVGGGACFNDARVEVSHA